MKILLLGNGAREHAMAWKLAQSSKKPVLVNFASARNPGLSPLMQKIEVGNVMDFEHLKRFAAAEKPDFALLGPDDPICAGAADALLELGIPSVGPRKEVAQLEGSKSFTRALLKKYDILGNPLYKSFSSEEGMQKFAEECGNIVVKADGLCGGKGVRVQGDHFSTCEEGIAYAKECLEQDGKVILEEKLIGQEFSLLFFSDGKHLIPMPLVQDNKRAFEGDEGPNTGGMGTVSFSDHSMPFLRPEHVDEAKEISMKTIGALQAETEMPFQGILFGGFMATANGVRLIEYNVRFGDPESLNLLPLLKTDFVDICEAILEGTLSELDIEFYEQASVCKYVVPEGYPTNPVKGEIISLDVSKIPEGVTPFYASLDEGMHLLGSRTIAFTAVGDSLEEAEQKAEMAAGLVQGPVFHRKDIGTIKLMSERVAMMKLMG